MADYTTNRLTRDILKPFAEPIEAAHRKGYGSAVADLDRATINLRAFSRGAISAEALPHYIKEAREALDRIEGALP